MYCQQKDMYCELKDIYYSTESNHMESSHETIPIPTNIFQLDGNDSITSLSSGNSSLSESESINDVYDDFQNSIIETSSVIFSESKDSFDTCNDSETNIPAWYDQPTLDRTRLLPVRIPLNGRNRVAVGSNLPAFSVCNMRSLMPKVDNFANDVLERNIDIAFLGEVWEKENDKSHKNKIERLLELKGIKYISTPRRTLKRGGGAALAVNQEKFHLDKLDIYIPKKL